jgi:hypothetical protein
VDVGKDVVVITYLTGSTNDKLERTGAFRDHGIGILIQPKSRYHTRLHAYPCWGGDNGAFTMVGAFCPKRFRAMLAKKELREHASTCLFIAAPDVLKVMPNGMVHADAVATLKQYAQWAHVIRDHGLPSALIAQNGLERMLDDVPWDLVDALFVGGSTEWKLGRGARTCVQAAAALGKHTHMGRVNSYRRLARAQSWDVNSADGTFLSFAPDTNLPRLVAWLNQTSSDAKQGRLEL